MITSFRRYLDSWVVRGLFILLLAVFAAVGLNVTGGGLRGLSSSFSAAGPWALKVGGTTVTPEALDRVYHQELAQFVKSSGQADPAPEMKRAVLSQAIRQVLLDAASAQDAKTLGLAVPRDELQRAIHAIPQFRGRTGEYDPAVARQILQANGYTEDSFADLVRGQIRDRQIIEPVIGGAAAPAILAKTIYEFAAERRSAALAVFPFSAVTAATPTDAELHRYFDNHPALYQQPEMRHVSAIVLTPQTLAGSVTVTDAELDAAYAEHKAEFSRPEQRSIQLILTTDQAKAETLAKAWREGAGWPAIQEAAKQAGATALDLPDSSRAELPSAELADAVFAAPTGPVADIEHDSLGYHVFRVTNTLPAASQTPEQAKAALKQTLIAQRAAGLMADRANALDAVLSKGATLEEIPSNLDAKAVAGTMDAQGNNADGAPAPIPGTPAFRHALADAAFAAKVGDPPRLIEVPPETPSGVPSYYALAVDSIVPPEAKPYDSVAAQVLADWQAEDRRRQQNIAATKLLTAIESGRTLPSAAALAGVKVQQTALADRTTPAPNMPPELLKPLFGLKPGEPAMVETAEGFAVAVPLQILPGDSGADPEGFRQFRRQLDAELANDTGLAYQAALLKTFGVQTNPEILNKMAQ